MANVHTKCIVCGEEIVQGQGPVVSKCDMCGKEFTSNNYCPKGHHICVDCFAEKIIESIKRTAINTKSRNPVEIADEIMSMPEFTLIGCKHYLVAAVSIYAAYKNCGGRVDNYIKNLDTIISRAKEVPVSMCKIGGFCGIPIAVGSSIHLTRHDSDNEDVHNKMSSKMTGYCVTGMFDEKYEGSMDCCKRNIYMSLILSARFIRDYFWVEMDTPEKIVCKYSKDNPRCNKDKCRLYRGLTPEE